MRKTSITAKITHTLMTIIPHMYRFSTNLAKTSMTYALANRWTQNSLCRWLNSLFRPTHECQHPIFSPIMQQVCVNEVSAGSALPPESLPICYRKTRSGTLIQCSNRTMFPEERAHFSSFVERKRSSAHLSVVYVPSPVPTQVGIVGTGAAEQMSGSSHIPGTC